MSNANYQRSFVAVAALSAIAPGATTPVPALPSGASPNGVIGHSTSVGVPCWYDTVSPAQWRGFGMRTCVLAADITTAAGALGNAAGMALAVKSNTSYAFKFFVRYRSNNVAAGIGLAIGTLAFSTQDYTVRIAAAAAGLGPPVEGTRRAANVVATSFTVDIINSNLLATVEGLITTGATSGNIQLRWLSSDGVSTITMRAGSGGYLQVVA